MSFSTKSLVIGIAIGLVIGLVSGYGLTPKGNTANLEQRIGELEEQTASNPVQMGK